MHAEHDASASTKPARHEKQSRLHQISTSKDRISDYFGAVNSKLTFNHSPIHHKDLTVKMATQQTHPFPRCEHIDLVFGAVLGVATVMRGSLVSSLLMVTAALWLVGIAARAAVHAPTPPGLVAATVASLVQHISAGQGDQDASQATKPPAADTAAPAQAQTPTSTTSTPTPTAKPGHSPRTCALKWCDKPCSRNHEGYCEDYCGRSHAREARIGGYKDCEYIPQCRARGCPNPCLAVVQGSKRVVSDFCAKHNAGPAPKAADRPWLLLVQDKQRLRELRNQFNAKWSGATPPTVERIFRIMPKAQCEAEHRQYALSLAGTPIMGCGGVGNTQRRFHGTKCACTLGVTDTNTGLCTAPACSICSIIRTRFLTARAGSSAGTAYGAGVYSSSMARKAYGYTGPAPVTNKRYMFMVSVTCGNVQLKRASGALPAGFHSRVVDASTSNSLDELIVFRDEALLPLYLLVLG